MTMTAPTRSGTRTKTRAGQAVAPDTVESTATALETAPAPTEQPTRRPRTAAAERAYARRAQREGRAPRRAEAVENPGGRARFVVLIIALLVVGIAATLWLSTQAIADSYRLEKARQDAADLSERADTLQREVTTLDSPAALAERAKELGMVFPGDPARLVVQPDGTVVVVGEPKPAEAPAPPPPPPADPPANQVPGLPEDVPQQGAQQQGAAEQPAPGAG